MPTLGAGQVAALDQHRGKGQQQVTVKHVHVGGVGQVAGVNAAGIAARGKDIAPPVAAAGQAVLAAPAEPILPPVSSALQRILVPRP